MIKRSIVLFAATAALFGCSSSSTSTPTPATDGGSTGGNTAKLTGQIVSFAGGTGSAGWTVTAGGQTATTNNKGAYELNIAKDTAFNLSVTDANKGYLSLWDQEAKISGDFDRGKLRFVEKGTGDTLIQSLQADPTKGGVTIELAALEGSACASLTDFPQGAKITVDQSGSKVVYQSGNLPAADKTEAQKGENPAAIAINATPDAELKVSVTYDKCKQKAFPVTVGNITYTGSLKPKGDYTLSVYRIFFE
jgi:hypothetical protein